MKRNFFNQLIVVILYFCISYSFGGFSYAQSRTVEVNVLPLSTKPVSGVIVHKEVNKSIVWDHEKYSIPDGIKVLMNVITNVHTQSETRVNALSKLSNLSPWLQNTDNIPELINIYKFCKERSEKERLIGCLATTEDKRILPLLTSYYSEATNDLARYQASYALANWNIRRGVSGLIKLLSSHELINGRIILANEVMKTLQRLNRQKGWGIPGKEILNRINENNPELDDNQIRILYADEFKKWFSINKHRFPVWNLGDPLPKIDKSD